MHRRAHFGGELPLSSLTARFSAVAGQVDLCLFGQDRLHHPLALGEFERLSSKVTSAVQSHELTKASVTGNDPLRALRRYPNHSLAAQKKTRMVSHSGP